jgi:hypothetical protein
MTDFIEAYTAASRAAENSARLARRFGEQAADAARSGRGLVHEALHAYETAVAGFVAVERQVAALAPAGPLRSALEAHAQFTREMGTAVAAVVRATVR